MEAYPGEGPSDEDLMDRLRGGEDSALAALMQRWEPPVKRFLYRMVGSAAEAEDLAQEVFARVYSKRAAYRQGSRFAPWCFAIAANQAKNRLRWWRRHPALSLDAWMEAGGTAVDPSATGSSASSQALRREDIERVRAAVQALPVELRTALVLFEYEAQSMADIALALGCTAKAVENRLYRARAILRKRLTPGGHASVPGN